MVSPRPAPFSEEARISTSSDPDSAPARAANARRLVNLLRAGGAEALGTYLLVLVGTAVATAAYLHKNTAGPAYDSLSIAMAFGLILIPLAGALGPVSGAHVNPAVTFGLACVGAFPWRAVPVYWIAQLLGGLAASWTVLAAYGPQAAGDARLGAPGPAHGASDGQVFLVEALIALILTLVVTAVTTDRRATSGVAPLAIGFALTAGVLLGGPVSGGAGNPARALGPMIATGTYGSWYAYALGPLAGAAAGAFLARGLRAVSPPTDDA